jgi:hypothetical protein
VLGVHRNATNDQINTACNKLIEKLEYPEYAQFTKENIEDFRHALTINALREIYDKQEVITTRDHLKQQGGHVPQS